MFFINNRFAALMITSAILFAGFMVLPKLPLGLMPSTPQPVLTITIPYPGITPGEIEKIICKPVEKIFRRVRGITSTRSVARQGEAKFMLEFEKGHDMKQGEADVRQSLELVRGSFSREVEDPVVNGYDPADQPVMVIAFPGCSKSPVKFTGGDVLGLKSRLSRIRGVAEVIQYGSPGEELHLCLDRSRLTAREKGPGDVAMAVGDNNTSMSCGKIVQGKRSLPVIAPLGFRGRDDVAGILVGNVPVTSLGNVSLVKKESRTMARYDGREGHVLAVFRKRDANALKICRSCRETLSTYHFSRHRVLFDQGTEIESVLDNIMISTVLSTLAVFIVVLVVIKHASSVAVIVAVPVCMSFTFLIMYLIKIDITVISLAGFAAGMGLVVDNSIIMFHAMISNESTTGYPLERVIRNNFPALAASTLTTIIVMAPLLIENHSPIPAGRDMAQVMIIMLVASLFSAMVPLPLAALYLRKKLNRAVVPGSRFLARMEPGVNRFLTFLINLGFNHRRKVFIVCGIISGAGTCFFPGLEYHMQGIRPDERTAVHVEYPTGYSLDATSMAVRNLERVLENDPRIESFSTSMFPWKADLSFSLKETGGDRDETVRQLVKKINAAASSDKGFGHVMENTVTGKHTVTITFSGDNRHTLHALARDFASQAKEFSPILKFAGDREVFEVGIHRDRAAKAGVSNRDIAEHLRTALHGPVITRMLWDGRQVDTRVRFRDEDRCSLRYLTDSTLVNTAGIPVPVHDLLSIKKTPGPVSIWRSNGRRSASVSVSSNVNDLGETVDHLTGILNAMSLPSGYSWYVDRNTRDNMNASWQFALLVLSAILLIYMLLASLYESPVLPLAVLASLPAGLSVPVILLGILDLPVTLPVTMGFIILMGMMVNNAIIMVSSFTTSRKQRGAIPDQSRTLKHLARQRIQPVTATTVTTLAGLLPLLIPGVRGSGMWGPMALVLFTGLSVSTLSTFLLVPSICEILINRGVVHG